MTTLKTIHVSMFTKIKHYLLLLTKNERVLEEPYYDYKLFQFMCNLEMKYIYEALEGQSKNTHIDLNSHQEYVNTLVVQLNLLQYVVFIVEEEGIVHAASILLMHSFDLYTVHRITNLSIPYLKNLENTLSK
ncbi:MULTISPECIES: hypothetical protein [Bacillus cereus group]|jgi:selenocysteine-specific translation elongation factor|uniref:Ypothetical protein n=1 Tax=Bacillus thuringiensis TaxID=1428 RepID=A0A9X6V9T0_BACTU|nr:MULTISPECIES: hypothetical protein [Bacillus cereus group]KIP24439.1 hypothetical protein BG10_1785 [Bacillus thuringiensis serovar morrisoni]MBG9640504.1 hypothetical protein [Bacillus thuringiensis]MBG9675975.1 hypothetical protein [Bacillus thuringiensis]MEC3269249.1 hypothetical protein [Bacillus thuringiensis]MEC3293902.1 hypothetical protein [Bacillus thuringiensis]